MTRSTSRKRAEILDAAARVFIRAGYDRASMDTIADEAGASKRTVYNHFPSKEELFDQVVRRFMTDSQQLKRVPYDSNRSLESQLAQFAHAMRQPTRDPMWLGLMKVITTSPALVEEILDQVNREEDTLVAWIQAANADGRLDAPDPELAAQAFWAMLSGAFLVPAIFAAPVTERRAEAIQDELVGMFLAQYRS